MLILAVLLTIFFKQPNNIREKKCEKDNYYSKHQWKLYSLTDIYIVYMVTFILNIRDTIHLFWTWTKMNLNTNHRIYGGWSLLQKSSFPITWNMTNNNLKGSAQTVRETAWGLISWFLCNFLWSFGLTKLFTRCYILSKKWLPVYKKPPKTKKVIRQITYTYFKNTVSRTKREKVHNYYFNEHRKSDKFHLTDEKDKNQWSKTERAPTESRRSTLLKRTAVLRSKCKLFIDLSDFAAKYIYTFPRGKPVRCWFSVRSQKWMVSA